MIIGKPPFETSDVKTTYRRIRMNAYNFPETVSISDSARNLITHILNNDPGKRPTVDEILKHPWINHEGTIPRLLPASTLACPPSSTYIRQFLPNPNFVKAKDMVGSGTAGAIMRSSNEMNGLNRNQLATDRQTAPYKQPPISGFTPPKDNEVWVKKWVDYSSKYGLGYCLSNEATGVFFNDSTKICLDPAGYHFDYMERRSADRQDVGKEYNLDNFPKDLQKKVTLLQHFRSYLEGT